MATKVRYKFAEILWISTVLCCGVLVRCRPKNDNSFIGQNSDPSDRTLIRVLRSEFEQDEQEKASLKEKTKKIPQEHHVRIKKRASEEDQFFQALLSRVNDKPVEKRSYESQPEKDDVKLNWKGDSKISDADKHELEHLFNSIGMVENEKKDVKRKVDAKRATKIGIDSKVQELVEWLMAKPPKEFHKSLRHIVDVEHQVSDMFSAAQGDQNTGETTSHVVSDNPATTTTTTETTSPVTATTVDSSSAPASVTAPVSVTNPVTSTSPLQTAVPSQVTSYTDPQPSMPAAPASVEPPPVSTLSSSSVPMGAKKPDVYADALQTSKMLARTGPGPIPVEAMNYFNKFPGGVAALPPPFLANYGVHPQEMGTSPVAHAPTVPQHMPAVPQQALAVPQQVPAVPQQAPAVPQQAPAVPQQAPALSQHMPAVPQQALAVPQQALAVPQQAPAVSQHMAAVPQQALAVPQQALAVPQQAPAVSQAATAPPAQYAQAAYGNMGQTAAPNPYQNQNAYNDQNNRQPTAPYAQPYRGRNPGYNPPPPPPYPLNRDELDKSTGKKKSVTVSLLFKQNWSSEFNNKKSTRARVFETEVKRELRRVFELKKNFKKIVIEKIREDRGKVDVTFTVVFRKDTKVPLKPLYEQIVRDHLGNMPVYRGTLFRGDDSRPKAPKRKPSKMEKSQSENPATEFADFAEKVDREMTGENIPLNVKHEAYQGCYKDKKPKRDMKKHFSKFEMTPDWCVNKCKKEGFRFAGVQYSYLCFCGNKFGKYGRVHDSECNSRCYGDRNRFCGSFWHNSIYSIDGQHHDVDEFSAIADDEPDEEESKDDDDTKKKFADKEEEKEHANVANHLMKAAASALQAAKKLLPGKNKRQTEEEFIKNKKDAQQALKAVDAIVADEKNVKKRSAESSDGRNLLMAYLGDVGGYDREYRSAEDEDKPVDKLKFDYKRMIIDEAGDGEFVVKPNKEKHLRRSRRSLETEDFDGRKKMALRAVDDSGDAMNPKTAVAEPSRRELLSKDNSDKEIKRRSRDADEEEEKEEEEEMNRNKKSKARKRSVGIDKSLYHSKVEEGLESVIGSILDAMKETSTVGSVKMSVEKLTNDVTNGLAIPDEQKGQVLSEIKQDIKDTGTARVNSLVTTIRTELNEYGEMHPAIGPQADEAAQSFSDIPLDETKAEEIKKKIRKRSLDESEEKDADKEKAFLSDILNEHFKLNP